MAEIIAGPLDWASNDEENLAKFLETETGRRLIPRLVDDAPILFAEGDTNKILIRAGEVRGYQAVVRSLLSLAHPSPKLSNPVAAEYPALDDDKAWADGQKLDPESPKPQPEIL